MHQTTMILAVEFAVKVRKLGNYIALAAVQAASSGSMNLASAPGSRHRIKRIFASFVDTHLGSFQYMPGTLPGISLQLIGRVLSGFQW